MRPDPSWWASRVGWNGADAVRAVEQYLVGLPGLEGPDLGVTGDLQVYGILPSGDLSAGLLQQQGALTGGQVPGCGQLGSLIQMPLATLPCVEGRLRRSQGAIRWQRPQQQPDVWLAGGRVVDRGTAVVSDNG